MKIEGKREGKKRGKSYLGREEEVGESERELL